MNGFSFVADTNFLIAVHEGKDFTEPFLDSAVVVSVISELNYLAGINCNPKKIRYFVPY